MKAWKAIGLAALAIGLAPYRLEKDEEANTSLYESLLMRVKIKRRGDGEVEDGMARTGIDVSFMPRLAHPEEYEDDSLSGRIQDGVEDLFGDKAEPVLHLVQEAAGKAEDVADKARDAVEEAAEKAKPYVEKAADAAFEAVNSAANKVKDALEPNG